MNDISPPGTSEAAPLPETADVPEASGSQDAPARPGRVRRKLLTALPAVLVLGAVGVAAGYTHATVDEADRSVETTVWRVSAREPGKDPARDTSRGKADTALSRLMLPVPAGYRLGPDDGEHGNDGEMDGKRAVAAMKEGNRGLAGKERRDYDKRIDKLRVQGLAVRSYTTQENDLEVHAQVMRMKDTKAVRSFYTFRTELFDILGTFRKGPEIKGHTRNATCYLQPEGDSEIEDMVCAAYDGELSISVSATGVKPVDKAAVAELLKDQLEHIKSPGEYV
ncbi:hypothetical protein [Streptomyces sp. HB132]|uniref:hypothetical protein n=1 Tax=Streptomyces sp. HB132 TaxID=767388 RepID=UPI001961D535|nr:hypothetical protein [Streptomyces sp. HB132]MBM7436693.1 hypothetical protein [Streptomyces sp. HB132]